MGKRYYWLKLQEDFFSCPQIKKLRRIAGGDTFTIIYLKMQLLSVKNGGVIEYQGIEPSFEEELSLIMDEDLDNVKITVGFLLTQGLLENSDDRRYLLTQAARNIGTECESAARVRAFRKRGEAKALPCNADVTPRNEIVTTEEDIDKDIDREEEGEPPNPPAGDSAAANDLGRCADFYQQNIGTLAPSTFAQLQDWLQKLPAEVIILAMQEAVDHGKRSWAYVKAILKRCADTGVRSTADFSAGNKCRDTGAFFTPGPAWKKETAQESFLRIAMEAEELEQGRGCTPAGADDDLLAESDAWN